MISKSERTTQYILETVAPVFNRHGYTATSMSDITSATGLTKGAIYGNFNNKEELAIKAFEFNVHKVVNSIREQSRSSRSPYLRLKNITRFYRNYKSYVAEMGGCPILNIGVDANNNNPELFVRVKRIIKEIQGQISRLIEKGQECGELTREIDADIYAGRIFGQIQGSIFLSVTMKSDKYMIDMMDTIDDMIDREMKDPKKTIKE